jgi:glycosyltransferase involved in cell wall biosynthesis
MLSECLSAIKLATPGFCGDSQVIVVDSSVESCASADSTETWVHVPHLTGPAAKRNLGARKAQYDWILFVDDDCRLTTDSLSQIQALTDTAARDVAGFAGVTDFTGPRSFVFRCCENSDFTAAFRVASSGADLSWAPTTALVLRRSAFLEVGGFDTDFGSAAGEDVDLGMRLSALNMTLKGVPVVFCRHTTESWNRLCGNLRRFAGYGWADVVLLKRYPGRHILKLNNGAIWMGMLLIQLAFCRDLGLGLAAVALMYVLLTTMVLSIYHAVRSGLALPYALGLAFFDRIHEMGATLSAFRHTHFRSLFLRFQSGPYSDKWMGREKIIYLREIVDLAGMTASLAGAILLRFLLS